MLSFMESAETNSKLDDMKIQNEIDKQNAREQEINKNISSLFQNLYNNNDITKIDLSTVSSINNFINEKFNYLKTKPKPKHNYFGLLGISILIILVLYIYKHNGITFLFVVLSIILGSLSLNAWADKKNIDNYKNTKVSIDKVLLSFKQQHSTLSLYGIYLKFYLDNHFQDIKTILNKNGEDKDMNMVIYNLYKVFDLNASIDEFKKWEYNIILNFNKDIINHLNNISITDEILYQDENLPQKLNGDSFKVDFTNNTIDLKKIDIKVKNKILQINPNFKTVLAYFYDIPRFPICLFEFGNKDKSITIDINNKIIENNSQEIFKEIDNIKNILLENKEQLVLILNIKKQIENDAEKFIMRINNNCFISICSYIDFGSVNYTIIIGSNINNNETKYFELDKNGNIVKDEIIELTYNDKKNIIEYFGY